MTKKYLYPIFNAKARNACAQEGRHRVGKSLLGQDLDPVRPESFDPDHSNEMCSIMNDFCAFLITQSERASTSLQNEGVNNSLLFEFMHCVLILCSSPENPVKVPTQKATTFS